MVGLNPSHQVGAAEPQADLPYSCVPRAGEIDLEWCGCRHRTVLVRDVHARACSLITWGYALEISAVAVTFSEPSGLMAPALLREVL